MKEEPHPPHPNPIARLPKPTVWAHSALRTVLREGDLALDATVGNGHDTLFLAQNVGSSGHVYGFDIQAEALHSTRRLLSTHSIPESRVSLFQTSHASLTEHLPPAHAEGSIRAVTFNLGYWPGGDKSVTTLSESTMNALEAARSVLAPGGLLSVVAYPGHPAGKPEAEAVADWMLALSAESFEVQHLRSLGRRRPPPELWLALRLR